MPEILSSSAGIENHGANLSGTEIPLPPSGLSRRTALAGLLAAYASAALAGSGCRGESGEKATPDTDTSRTPSPPPPENEVPAFPGTTEIDPSIPMPTSEIVDTPYEFPVHPDLKESMTPVQFAEKAKVGAAAIARYVDETLVPALEKAREEESDPTPHILKAIGNFPVILVNVVPEFAPSFQAFFPHAAAKGHPHYLWVKYLKPFLEAGGYFFEVEGENENLQMAFCPIVGTQHIDVSDGESSFKVPLLRIGKNKIDPLFSNRHPGTTGGNSDGFTQIYLFEDHIEPTLDASMDVGKSEWPRFSRPLRSSPEFEEIKKRFRRNVIHHEAVHAFLARKFPGIADIQKRGVSFSIKTKVRFTRQAESGAPSRYDFNLNGDFSPVMIQELAAVGAHLAFSPIEEPWEHFNFILTHGGKDYTYRLASTILAIGTMWMAPVSPMHELSTGTHASTTSGQDVEEVIGNEPYTQADTQAVGEAMYRIAYGLFRKIAEALDK